MARRIRNAVGGTESALPSVVLYDYAECQNSEPLPFFFQRTAGKGFKGTTRPITRGYVARVLGKVCAAAGLVGVDGTMIAFTAHDFRRVFATDALAAGLPPHIIQKLMGHASIATTQGYTAIFPEDVIRSHRAFIENRRRLRPAEEYRVSARQSGAISRTTSLSARSPSATACVLTAPAASTNTPVSNANSPGQTPRETIAG